ncbi:hypothetical protein DIURU_002721 [Diutina rugosa]|uniref:Uncharacterized protein n=1 Tax=Diutina rugosa TaxID=5481 RepID=A0A642UVX1_DIURU|nr:uncharacterized protein DIURU_002721 [Diutina rugosa]KAA8902825.1 hypothetical protein DIURU_002721 [Diutina rugosa]
MVEDPVTFDYLPLEIQRHVLWFLDVPSVCRACVAFAASRGAQAAADILADEVVEVCPTSLPGSEDDIDFALLAQLPPCKVFVNVSFGRWRGVVARLNQVKSFRSLEVTLDGDYDPLSGNFRFLRHPIDKLNLKYLTISDYDIPNCVKSLTVHSCEVAYSFMRHLENLETLSISGMAFPPSLPESLVDVTLPDDWAITFDPFCLPNLTATNIAISGDLCWQKMTKLTNYFIPCESKLTELKHIVVGDKRGLDSFKSSKCPNLETVWVSRSTFLHPWDTDASVLFTEAQMAKLTELMLFDYHISDFTPFSSLKVARVILNEPLTENLPLPPTLTDFEIDTAYPIEGIPPQLKSLLVINLNENDKSDVVIDAPNIRKLVWCNYHNLTLKCPRLTDFSVSTVTGKMELDAPNLVKLDFQPFDQYYPFEKHPLLSTLDLHGDTWKDIVVPHPLQSLVLNDVVLETLEVDAKRVEIVDSIMTGRVIIKADSVYTDIAMHDADVSIDCRILETPIMYPVSYTGVEQLTLLESDDPVECDFFENFTKLTHLELQSLKIECSQLSPLVIPASVKSLTLVNCTSDEFWFHFEDETQLEYLGITYWNNSDDDTSKEEINVAYFTQETLGLTAMPPSYYCPGLKGGVVTQFKRPRIEMA